MRRQRPKQTYISYQLSLSKPKTDAHNAREGAYPIVYQYGIAFEDGEAAPTITELIALSNQRIYKEEQQDYE